VSLTDAEHDVAAGIEGARARARYVTGRTVLRRHLGEILECDPLAVDITDGPDGKPALADAALAFNVSHAGDWLLIAISRPRRLGVDVEQVRPDRDIGPVIEHALAPADRSVVCGGGFFRYWTRYEAIVKARGDGLVLPLRPLAEVVAGLEVQELDVAPGYVGAVAADRGPWRVVRCA
jgi:4'-phosphopantetheinyl transferase